MVLCADALQCSEMQKVYSLSVEHLSVLCDNARCLWRWGFATVSEQIARSTSSAGTDARTSTQRGGGSHQQAGTPLWPDLRMGHLFRHDGEGTMQSTVDFPSLRSCICVFPLVKEKSATMHSPKRWPSQAFHWHYQSYFGWLANSSPCKCNRCKFVSMTCLFLFCSWMRGKK